MLLIATPRVHLRSLVGRVANAVAFLLMVVRVLIHTGVFLLVRWLSSLLEALWLASLTAREVMTGLLLKFLLIPNMLVLAAGLFV